MRRYAWPAAMAATAALLVGTVPAVSGAQALAPQTKAAAPVVAAATATATPRKAAPATSPVPSVGTIPAWVPAKCRNYQAAQVICVARKSHKLVALQGSQLFIKAAARTGATGKHRASDGTGPWPTRLGTHRIFAKYRDKVSTLYDVHMPYFMPFSGGQGIHYSSEYANGYRYSHGCVGLKSLTKAKKLFDWAKIGTVVIVVNA